MDIHILVLCHKTVDIYAQNYTMEFRENSLRLCILCTSEMNKNIHTNFSARVMKENSKGLLNYSLF